MGWILVVAVAWLFLLVLAVAILRSAAEADRAAERRRREPRPRPATSERRRRAARAAVIVVAVPLAGATLGARDADAVGCKTARAASQMSAPSATLCLINRQRRADGLASLVGNARLGRAATLHAWDMIQRGYFAQASPDGIGFAERLRRAGYTRLHLVGGGRDARLGQRHRILALVARGGVDAQPAAPGGPARRDLPARSASPC